jgi:hypothetical protein
MDIPAFGSYYSQTSMLPYASGFVWKPSDGPKTFSTCRSVYVIPATNASVVYITLNDGQGQPLPFSGFSNNPNLPVGATSISGGNITSAVVLY